MNRITITLTLDLPEGVTPSVDYGAAPSSAPRTQPAASSPPPTAAGWVCPIHHTVKTVPGGVSKKTGKPYGAFLACTERDCNEKPPRDGGPSSYPVQAPAPAADGSQFDDLPF